MSCEKGFPFEPLWETVKDYKEVTFNDTVEYKGIRYCVVVKADGWIVTKYHKFNGDENQSAEVDEIEVTEIWPEGQKWGEFDDWAADDAADYYESSAEARVTAKKEIER